MTHPDRDAEVENAAIHRMITISADTPRDGVVVLTVSGEVDLLTIEELEGKLRDALQPPNRVVVLDLAEVRFMGSAGLSALISGAESARSNGLEFLLVADERAILRPLEMTGITSTFVVYDSVNAALETVRS